MTMMVLILTDTEHAFIVYTPICSSGTKDMITRIEEEGCFQSPIIGHESVIFG